MAMFRESIPLSGVDRTVKADNRNTIEIIDGDTFNRSAPGQISSYKILFKGGGICSELKFDERMLSTHIMMLGGIGTGKSNTFYHLINQIRSMMSSEDVLIIFDTKGDFLEKFWKNGDVVIGNGSYGSIDYSEEYWNIFDEIDDDNAEEDIREICRSLFKESIDNSPNAYFPTAASDLFYGIMYCLYHQINVKPSNKQLIDYIKKANVQDYIDLLSSVPQLRYITNHISMPNSPQTQGVISEMNSTISKIFIGNFAKKGNLSMRNLINERNKTIFIEYDIKTGEVLTPIYSLMIDLAIKQALSNGSEKNGSVYILIDEFKLLPHLAHIDDAVNFGRSLGLKIVIGLQSITQIYDCYGEYRAKSILSGFLNNFFFRVNNYESREYIKNYFGESIEKITYGRQNDVGECVLTRSVVKDKDISRLKVGEAIIAMPNVCPFIFKFEEWKD